MNDDTPAMLTVGGVRELRQMLAWWRGQATGAKLSQRRAAPAAGRPFASGTISGYVDGDASGQTYEVELSDPQGEYAEDLTVEAWLNLDFYEGSTFDIAKRFKDGIRVNLEWRYARWEITTLPCPVAANLVTA